MWKPQPSLLKVPNVAWSDGCTTHAFTPPCSTVHGIAATISRWVLEHRSSSVTFLRYRDLPEKIAPVLPASVQVVRLADEDWSMGNWLDT